MDDFYLRKVHKKMMDEELNWVCKFNVNDYVDNPPLIEKLYEEKQHQMLQCFKIQKELDKTNEVKHNLELKIAKIKIELDAFKSQKYLWFYILSLIPPILIGLGVNFVTSDEINDKLGWWLIGIASLIKIIEFFLPPRKF